MLGTSSTIEYFNKAFKNFKYSNELNLASWDFTSARSVSEMFYDFTGSINLTGATYLSTPLHPSRNNAYLTSYRYNLVCGEAVSKSFNYNCPEAEEELDLYHRWWAETSIVNFDDNPNNNIDEPNVMKLVFSVTPGNMTVRIPISAGYDKIWWGDGTSTEGLNNEHDYTTPGEYTVYIKPLGNGIVYDLSTK